MSYDPQYSGPKRSGMCKCGHPWQEHHLGMVGNHQYWRDTGEIYVAQECEHFGANEMGGLDEAGNLHCDHYVDDLS